MQRRFPNENSFSELWPRDVPTEDKKANKSIYCPVMKHWTGIIISCFNCDIGFNSRCKRLNTEIAKEPDILKEIYRPVFEFRELEMKEQALVYKRKLISIKHHSKIDTSKAYLVIGKYKLIIRFIPRYEECEVGFKNKYYWDKKSRKVMNLDQLLSKKSTGDIIYVLSKDRKYLDILNLVEKLK